MEGNANLFHQILKKFFSDVGLISIIIDRDGTLETLALIEGNRGNAWRFQRVSIISSTKYKVYILDYLN